ncbi:hypothetical protein CCACVL1_08433, partial [Corchorus capsularis]
AAPSDGRNLRSERHKGEHGKPNCSFSGSYEFRRPVITAKQGGNDGG